MKLARLRTRHTIEDLAHVDTGEPIAIPLELELGLMLECELTRPPSSAGHRVRLVIPPEQLLPLHKVIKDEMRRQRSQPMSAAK